MNYGKKEGGSWLQGEALPLLKKPIIGLVTIYFTAPHFD
jgi:hypothetical protein